LNCPNCQIPLSIVCSDLKKVTQECPKCEFSTAKNYLKIDQIYAFVSVDPEDQNEGIIAMNMNGTAMPLIAADKARLKSMRPIAQETAIRSKTRVMCLKFSSRTELESYSFLGGKLETNKPDVCCDDMDNSTLNLTKFI